MHSYDSRDEGGEKKEVQILEQGTSISEELYCLETAVLCTRLLVIQGADIFIFLSEQEKKIMRN